jgi:hypothetical protein
MLPTFYDQGLKFECTQCHACCRHDPGYVFLSRQDLNTLAAGVGMEPRAFVEKYCRWVDLGQGLVLSLKEKKNFDCIFWDGGCTVYTHRPVQCRTYPFWEGPMASVEKWKWEGRFCPGINQGKLRDKTEIEEALAKRRENPVLHQGEV